MLKSTQTNKYETACFIQETPQASEINPRGFELKRSIKGEPFIVFPATLQTYNCQNRMGRRYDANNVISVINNDERIQTLKRQNKWRGELNHPNPDIKGEQLTDIRMTIPEPMRTSHFINKDRLEGDRLRAEITTHPGTECGRAVTSEIVDLGAVPSFSVRVFANMIPNAPATQPNIRVARFITADMVDFPSHRDADGDIRPITESAEVTVDTATIIFLKQLAQYACQQDTVMQAVCESFQISLDEVAGINNGSIMITENTGGKMFIPLKGDIRREVISELTKRGMK